MNIKRFVSLAVAALCLLALTACKKSEIYNPAKVDSAELQFQGVQAGDTIATIKTNKGNIKVVLYPQLAPLAVENFVTHAQNGYYNGITFHRVIEGFVIQGGDPTGTGSGGESIWQLPFNDEFSDKLRNYTGALSMANAGANTNGSQFFIVTEKADSITDEIAALMEEAGWRQEVISAYKQSGGAPNLDYKHTVFGQVYEGLDVAFAISKVKTDEKDKPKEAVIIESIEISKAE